MALTKVTGHVVSPTSDYTINNVTGVAATFNNVTGVAATFTGNVTIGGTLTYEDVTNIDSIGIVTARGGLHVGVGGTIIHALSEDDGKVGIGTDNPTAQLEVKGSGSSNTLNFLTKDVNKNTVFYAKDGGQVGLHYYPLVINQDTTDTATPSGTYFYVHHSSSPFIIKNDGKVGIGSAIPSQLLDIGGNTTVASNGRVNIYRPTSGSTNTAFQINSDVGGTDTTQFVIQAGGKVGIKTLAPAHDLDVYLNGRFNQLGAGGYGALVGPGTHTGGFTYMSSGDMEISCAMTNKDIVFSDAVGGNQRMRLLGDTGRLGIGTNNPNALLDVYQDGTGTVVDTIMSRTSGGGGFGIQCSDVAAANPVWAVRTYYAEDLVLSPGGHANAHEKVRIKADTGNVGIGTTDPDYGLHVYGAGDILIEDSVNGSAHLRLRSANNGSDVSNWKLKTSSNNYFYIQNDTVGGASQFTINDSGDMGLAMTTPRSRLDVFETTTDNQTAIRIGNSNTPSGANDKRLEFVDGVGTTEGTNKYTYGYIQGFRSAASNAGDLIFGTKNNNASAPTEKLRITSGGNVGIGTDDPQDVLTLYDADNNVGLYFQSPHTGSSGGDGFRIGRNDTHAFLWNYENQDIALATNGSERLTVTSAGITVTGEVKATQDYPNIRPTLDFNFAVEKKLDPRFAYSRTGPASFVNDLGKVVIIGPDVPRFDHDPITRECKGLLIEQNRTNLFSGTANMAATGSRWSIGGSRGFEGANIEGPDGTLTSFQVVYNGTSGDLGVAYSPIGGSSELTTSNDTIYTYSVWAKLSAGASYLTGCRLRTYSQNISVNYNLVNGLVLGDGTTATNAYENQGSDFISSSIEEYPNGWYRCIMTFRSGTDGNQGFQLYLISGVNNHALNSSSANGESVSFWGAQLEEGSFATSFIPTGINQESVTRGVESVTLQGTDFSDFYNQNEGTIVLSASFNADVNRTSAIVTIDDISNTSEYIEVGYRAGGGPTGNVASYVRTDSGGDQYFKQYGSSATAGAEFKVAFGYKDNDYASSVNGATVDTDTSGTTSKVLDRLSLSYVDTVNPKGSGLYRRLMYYPHRLPNNQLLTLTS